MNPLRRIPWRTLSLWCGMIGGAVETAALAAGIIFPRTTLILTAAVLTVLFAELLMRGKGRRP